MNPGYFFIGFLPLLALAGFFGAWLERGRVHRKAQLSIERADPGYRASGKAYVARIIPDDRLPEVYTYIIDDISQIPDDSHRRIAARRLDNVITFWCNCRYGVGRWIVKEDIYSPAHVDE